MPTVDDALWLLNDRGFSIIPIHNPSMSSDVLPPHVRKRVDPQSPDYAERDVGKLQLLVGWKEYQERQPREAEVRKWWKDWPGANIGVPCGKVSNVFVVDADGQQALGFLATLDIFPGSTLTSRTGRPDGYQFFFLWPGWEVRNNVAFLENLDIRGDGGYVVAPPSLHRLGPTYAWVEGMDRPLPAPEGLLDMLRQSRQHSAQVLPRENLRRLLQGAPDGQRHNAANALAAHWFGIGMPHRAVQEAMIAWAAACTPPADESHILKIVDWVAGEEAKKRRDPEEPVLSRHGDVFTYAWPDIGLRAELSDLREERGGLQVDIDITSEALGDLHYGRLVLQSTSGREELVRKLSKVRNDINWPSILERICKRTAGEWKRSSLPVDLADVKPRRDSREILTGVLNVVENTISILFAHMASGKSTIGLLCCLALAQNRAFPGIVPREQTTCLIIDNENITADENALRLEALCKGAGIAVPRGIRWWHLRRSIQDEKEDIKAYCDREGIGFVLVDSFAGAAGKGPETADAGLILMDALHSIGRTSLIIAHMAKAGMGNGHESDDSLTAYGSVYNSAKPRNSWAVKVERRTDGELVVKIIHRKINLGKFRPTQYLRFEYEGSGDVPERIHVTVPSADEFSDTDRLADIVSEVLVDDWQTTVQVFKRVQAVDDQAGYESVRTTLRRMLADKTIENEPGRGRGHPARWKRIPSEDL